MYKRQLLTCSFASYVSLIRRTSEVNQLKEVLKRVAAKAEEAIVAAVEHNATTSIVIRLPIRIGENDYWIRFSNDSSKAWVEGAFGETPRDEVQEYRVYLPKKVYASGTFVGKYELAVLDCSLNGSTPQLTLSQWG